MAVADNRANPWTFVLDEPLRILVVDDDPILREFANVYLSTPSATIDTACDGAAARIRLGENRYDLLLLDIEMPHLDGFSLLEEIRSNDSFRHLPVIMLTGHDDIASIDRAYQVGANSFATKPVNWRQLSYQIRYVVRTSRVDTQQGRLHLQPKEPGSGLFSAATERDVRDFQQYIIDRALALEEQLTVHDRERYSGLLQGVRSFAKRAFTQCSGQAPGCAADGVRRAEVSDLRDPGVDHRALTD